MYNHKSVTARKNPWGDDHPEKLREQGSTVGFKQQLKGLISPDKMLSQIFQEKSKEQSVPLSSKEKPLKKANEVLLFSRLHEKSEDNISHETHLILEKLKQQISILEKSEENLVKEVGKVKYENLPAKTGIYYIRFLEWLLLVVKQLRMKIEDGKAWLETFNHKKKKKLGYWQKYKKHGTTFGLSQERTLATQTG